MQKIISANRTSRVVLSLIIGLLLILFPRAFQNSIIYIIGGAITVFGTVKLITYFMVSGQNSANKTSLISTILVLLFGLIMILNADFFIGIIVLFLGFMLIIAGLSQIMMYRNLANGNNVPMGMYISPALILLGGIFTIANPFGVTQTLIQFFGCVTVFYSISELVSMFIIKSK